MLAGWSRAFVVVTVVAVIGNAHCFGNCTSWCSPAKTTSTGCHHEKHSGGDTTPCSHQHSEFAGPETGLAKISVAATGGIQAVLTEISATVSTDTSFFSR